MSKITYKKLKERIMSEPEQYLATGQKKGYFVLDGNKIKYQASAKKYNFLDPEEKVRARYYFDLIEKYKYPLDYIEFDVEIAENRFADIVVYEDFGRELPYILVECKKDGISDAEFERALKQAVNNARALKAKFAVCVAGDVRRVIEMGKTVIADIPVCYGKVKESQNKKSVYGKSARFI